MHTAPDIWLVHIAEDRERDREKEKMGSYIALYTVHTYTLHSDSDREPLFSIVPFPVPCSAYEPLELIIYCDILVNLELNCLQLFTSHSS